MSIKAKISQQSGPVAVVSTLGAQVQVPAVGIQGVSGSLVSMSSIGDVEAPNPENGSLLIYNTNITKWVASRQLNAQDMDGGNF